MSNKLYVGNISFQVGEAELEEAFSPFGQVQSVKIITDFETGRSKGFGFVEMETEEEAEASIAALDGKDFSGRNMRVSIAKERKPRSGGGGGRGPRGGNRGGGFRERNGNR